MTLYDDIKDFIEGGFDAVICLGNSFAHMTDSFGDQREQKQAIRNFEKCVKPGGLLLIDHRNYDNIMETGSTPSKSIYYNVSGYQIYFKFSSLTTLNLSLIETLACKEYYIVIKQNLLHWQSDHMTDIKTSVLYVSGKPNMVVLDYLIQTGDESR